MWSRLSNITKYSLIGFIISLGLGLLSMGVLGYAIYYLVSPIMGNRIDELSGDAMWPSLILAGMLWSVGFLIAGLVLKTAKGFFEQKILQILIYIIVLWLWALIIWWWLIEFRIVQ